MRTPVRAFLLVALITVGGYAALAQQGAPARPATARPAATVARPAGDASPESVGISSERLGRLHRGMQDIVARREAAGIVTLVGRDGKIVDVHASGYQDVESKTAMKTDTIFRIASMS